MAQRKYEDFAKRLYELFPHIEESSIDAIANHGLKQIYHYTKYGGDIFLKNLIFFLFIGENKKEGMSQWTRSKYKEHAKRRKLFTESKEPWDKQHYFGLTEEENSEFIKNGIISSVTLYKIITECRIRKNIKYIYKTDLGYTIPDKEIVWAEKRDNISLDKCELSPEGVVLLEKRRN